MTNRQFLQMVIAIAEKGKENNITILPEEVVVPEGCYSLHKEITMEEVIDFAQDQIEKLNTRNANRVSKPTKVQIENEPIKGKIIKLLTETNEKYIASAIAEKIGVSTQKASALCRQLVEDGKLQIEEVKVPKKGTQKAYSVIA